MTVRKVVKMGHPVLLQPASPVESFNTPQLDELVEDMLETMYAYDGAGLAAPQIAFPLRVIIFGVEANPRYPDVEPVEQTVLINPEISFIGKEMESAWEGCLSVPGMRGLVERHKTIHYSGYDQHGHRIERDAEGFHARVVQHEVDHLDGILYPQRIRDMRNFGFEDTLFAESSRSEDSPC